MISFIFSFVSELRIIVCPGLDIFIPFWVLDRFVYLTTHIYFLEHITGCQISNKCFKQMLKTLRNLENYSHLRMNQQENSFELSRDHHNDEYAYRISNPKHMPKYTKAKVPYTQDIHTQLSSFTWLHCSHF